MASGQQQQQQKVAMVTGGNKGVGLGLVRRLCQLPFPGTVYLTSRDVGRGQAAVDQLKVRYSGTLLCAIAD